MIATFPSSFVDAVRALAPQIEASATESEQTRRLPALGLCPAVGLTVKPVGERSAGNPHAAFDERGWETGRLPIGSKLPRPSSTLQVRTPCAATAARPDREVFIRGLD